MAMQRVSVTGGSVIKDKNIVEFIPNGKASGYILDINTGILYGLKGKPVEGYPAFVVKASNELENKTNDDTIMIVKNFNIIRNCRGTYGYNFNMTMKDMQQTGLLLLVDRIINAVGNISLYHTDFTSLKYIEKHFSDFVKYMKDNEIYPDVSLEGKFKKFMNWHTNTGLIKKYNMENDTQFTKDVMLPLLTMGTIEEKKINILLWYIRNQLNTFFDNRSAYVCRDYLETYVKMCEEINKPLEKGNFLSVYNAIKREYDLRKNEIDMRKLANKYAKHNKVWEFETDKYCVRIPQTAEDFIKEGRENCNCVSAYANKVLNLESSCYVCFIRNKEYPDHAFITADIYENSSGVPYINQFLLKHNTSVYHNEELIELRRQFALWVVENW